MRGRHTLKISLNKLLMTKFKKIALIATASIIFVLVLIYISIVQPGLKTREKETAPVPGTLPEPLLESALETATEKPFNVISKLKKDGVQIPEKLAVYTLKTEPFSFTESVNIAKRFGFSGKLRTLEDVSLGEVYVLYENAGYLRIVPSLRLIDFKASIPYDTAKQFFPEDNSLISTAKKFLIEKGVVSEKNLEFSEIRFLDVVAGAVAVTEREQANTADVHFREKLNQYPVVNVTVGVGTISVRINKDGQVVAAYVDQTDSVSDKKDYPLKTFEELELSLPKAKIHGLEHGSINLFTLRPDEIEIVTIEKASIGYFQEYGPNQTLLQPVFVLEGKAKLQDRDPVSALLYLPAISDKYLNP